MRQDRLLGQSRVRGLCTNSRSCLKSRGAASKVESADPLVARPFREQPVGDEDRNTNERGEGGVNKSLRPASTFLHVLTCQRFSPPPGEFILRWANGCIVAIGRTFTPAVRPDHLPISIIACVLSPRPRVEGELRGRNPHDIVEAGNHGDEEARHGHQADDQGVNFYCGFLRHQSRVPLFFSTISDLRSSIFFIMSGNESDSVSCRIDSKSGPAMPSTLSRAFSESRRKLL